MERHCQSRRQTRQRQEIQTAWIAQPSRWIASVKRLQLGSFTCCEPQGRRSLYARNNAKDFDHEERFQMRSSSWGVLLRIRITSPLRRSAVFLPASDTAIHAGDNAAALQTTSLRSALQYPTTVQGVRTLSEPFCCCGGISPWWQRSSSWKS